MIFILFSKILCLDIEEVLVCEFHFHAGHFHHVAGGLHDVVDLTLHVLAILGGLVGLEGVHIPILDWKGHLGLVSSSGANEAES